MVVLRNILLVEDEPLIAMMLEDVLDALDRSVVASVDSVPEALAAVRAGGIDAAILDVNLRGGEKSWPIADALSAAGIPFLFATGGSDDEIPQAFAACPRLPKPFTIDRVAKALDAMG